MSDVREVNSNLVLASGMRLNFKIAERLSVAFEMPQQSKTRLCRQAIWPNAILDRHMAVEIASERFRNFSALLLHMSVHDGKINFPNVPALPSPPQRARDRVLFRDDNQSARFAIEPIDQMILRPQMDSHTPDE